VLASEFALVGLGGALGAMSRFGCQYLSPMMSRENFYPTLTVNLIGCFVIGVVWALLNHYQAPPWINRLLVTGFLGGFTTFSSFALDATNLAAGNRLTTALLYVGISVIGGLVACALAVKLTKAIL
jgi:CrcB protein